MSRAPSMRRRVTAMNDAFAIVYAKQGVQELQELIELRSAAALPLGGRYRMIDILLSNLSNSGVRSVGLITQRNYKSLIDHIGSGKEWNLSKKVGGLRILPPYDLATSRELYRGILDALLDKRDFIEHQRWKYCLIVATDKVYRQDYNAMLERHIETQADITVLCSHDAKLMDDDSQTTYFEVDNGIVKGIYETPIGSDRCYTNLGASLISKELLIRLVEDACADGHYAFDANLLKPAIKGLKIAAVEHKGYVGRLNSVKSYFDLNKDILDSKVRDELFDPSFPVYTKTMDAPPSRFTEGSSIHNSLFGTGCVVSGNVRDSVVFRGVHIDRGAEVSNCIVMGNTLIGAGAKVCNMIIDKDVVIEPGTRVISAPYDPKVIRKGTIISEDRA